MFRRRSGQDTDIAASVYQYPPGTDPSWLMPYEVHSHSIIIIIIIIGMVISRGVVIITKNLS